jgi:hypothetical protein
LHDGGLKGNRERDEIAKRESQNTNLYSREIFPWKIIISISGEDKAVMLCSPSSGVRLKISIFSTVCFGFNIY